MNDSTITRRTAIQAAGTLGLAGALAGAAQVSRAGSANADPWGSSTRVRDLGPAVTQFALMSGVVSGDTLYIGSRNVEPSVVVAYDLMTRKVTATTAVSNGYSIQAMAADPTGRYLYVGVLDKVTGNTAPNLFRWDLSTPQTPAVDLGRIGDRDVRAITVAPDGVVFAVGGGSPTAPALWQFDPATGAVTSLGVPDPSATLARTVAATETTVFFGAGSTLGGGDGASRACLFAYDRAGATFTNVTPTEMLPDPSIRDFLVVGDHLAVSSAGSTEPAKFAWMSLADLGSYQVAESTSGVAKMFAAVGDDIYYATDSGLNVYSTTANTVTPVELDGEGLGEIWGVAARDGELVVTSAYGVVVKADPTTGATTWTDLAEAGAPLSPQTCMGIAAGPGHVYVGGNGVLARHAKRSQEILNLRAPGEAKDALVLGQVLYTGQYNAQGIWSYDPRTGEQPRQVADFPETQNRPLDVCWDEVNRLVLVAAQSDTEGGGSLWRFDPRTGEHELYVNPIDDRQLLRAVVARGGVAYVGGDNTTSTGPRCEVVAMDPRTGREKWRLDPQQTAGIAALAIRGAHLYGIARKGTMFVIDLKTRAVIHTANISSLCNGFAALTVSNGVVYGVSDTSVFRFNPWTFEASAVIADANGAWYSGSHIDTDGSGRLYTLRGHNLVEIADRPRFTRPSSSAR